MNFGEVWLMWPQINIHGINGSLLFYGWKKGDTEWTRSWVGGSEAEQGCWVILMVYTLVSLSSLHRFLLFNEVISSISKSIYE